MAMLGSFHIPQYLRSEDPEIVAIVEANEAGANAWAKEAYAFSQKYGVPHSVGGEVHTLIRNSFGEYRVTGLSGAQPTEGRWKRLDRGWAPYVKNPVHAEMTSLVFRNTKVPGLPEMVSGSSGEGLLLMWPMPFLWDGKAWVKFSAPGTASTDVGPQWVEVLGSEVMAAHEKKYPKEKD